MPQASIKTVRPTDALAQASGTQSQPALCLVGACDVRLWSHTPGERLARQFSREGVDLTVSPDAARLYAGPVIVLRADAVIDQPLIPFLVKQPNLLLTDGERVLGGQVQGGQAAEIIGLLASGRQAPRHLELQLRRPEQLDADFWMSLRKRETPYAMIVTAQNKADVEWRMFMGTYKGATDIVTKYLWPLPAFHVTRWLAPTAITPNMVTFAGLVLTCLAFWLFLQGYYALGLAAAWTMIFLDTVDGKLARTTLTSSRWGNVFDHGIDLVHPPFWYAAWALGLAPPWDDGLLWTVIGAITVGYVLQRAMEGIALRWLGLQIHIWRPIDTLFRQITARRNPNLVILTAATLIGRPDWGLIAVAAWTVACLILHGLQLSQALAARRTGPLASWMTRRS